MTLLPTFFNFLSTEISIVEYFIITDSLAQGTAKLLFQILHGSKIEPMWQVFTGVTVINVHNDIKKDKILRTFLTHKNLCSCADITNFTQ